MPGWAQDFGGQMDALFEMTGGGFGMPMLGSAVESLGVNRAMFQGMEIGAVRDLSHLNVATLKAMREFGFAPTTVNGESIVLHHLGQLPEGPLVEMPGANHSIGNIIQHPLGNAPGVGLNAAQRASYNAWRVEYWKARAAQELAKRGL